MVQCTQCKSEYHSSCQKCAPKVHDNNCNAPFFEGLPVVFAPGFEDYQILKDHTGCDIVFVGQETVINSAILAAITPEFLAEIVRNANADQRNELRNELGPLIVSGDPNNSIGLGSDNGAFENDAL